jgi:hypothetical protein
MQQKLTIRHSRWKLRPFQTEKGRWNPAAFVFHRMDIGNESQRAVWASADVLIA